MPYDEGLAQRIREAFDGRPGISERKMFGGLCFLLNSNMACGVTGEELMVRVGPDGHADTLERPQARTKPFTGRPMKGFVFVSSSGIESDIDLLDWVERGVLFASTFPPK